MRRIPLAAVVFAAAAVVAPAAQANSADTALGGCFVYEQPTFGSTYAGVIGDLSATFDTAAVPIGAAVSCWIEVNGVEAPGTRHAYGDIAGVPGVQAGKDSLTYSADPNDFVVICEHVDYADGTSSNPDLDCPVDASPEIPAREVWDFYEATMYGGRDAVCGDSVDACQALCPVLASMAGTYNRLTIGPDGDVYLAFPGFVPPYRRVFDCP